MQIAVKNRNEEATNILLSNGAEVYYKDNPSMVDDSPIFLAIKNGDQKFLEMFSNYFAAHFHEYKT